MVFPWFSYGFPMVSSHGHQDIIAILGMDELSEEDKLTVARARKARSGMGAGGSVIGYDLDMN